MSGIDNLTIYPHIHCLPLRLPYNPNYDFLKEFSAKNESDISDNDGLKDFLQELSMRRSVLLDLLAKNSDEEETLDIFLKSYLSLLNHLIVSPDVIDVTERGVEDQSKLLYAFDFGWYDCFVSKAAVNLPDVRFEIISVLLACAQFKAREGRRYLNGESLSGHGVSSFQTSKMFKFYREAVGYLEHCLKIIPNLKESYSDTVSTDCDEDFITALRNFLLAEVQSITVLRSIEKGNAPSLIANLAMDVFNQFVNAKNIISSKITDISSSNIKKLNAYIVYKSLCFQTYLLSYHAWSKLSSSIGGEAVRLAQEAEKTLEESISLGKTYDSCKPITHISEREKFQEVLGNEVKKIKNQAETDNRQVYLLPVPHELPDMPVPQALVAAIIFEYPSPDPLIDRKIFSSVDTKLLKNEPEQPHVIEIIDSNPDDIKKKVENKENKGGHWWQWLLVIIAMPFLIIASILGFFVWIILLPVKMICCPVGCLAQMLWNLVEFVIKAPANILLWASGKPWKTEDESKEKNIENQKT